MSHDASDAKSSSKKDAKESDAPADGPCNFATYVIGLIKDDTTATSKPTTDLGASCTDDQKQSDFASLFP
jgi:hypothetical protein